MFNWRRRSFGTTGFRAVRAPRAVQDMIVALGIVLLVFGFAAWNNRAEARGYDSPQQMTASLAGSEFVSTGQGGIGAVRLPDRQAGPGEVPGLVLPDVIPAAALPPLSAPDNGHTRVAIEDQVLWHQSGRAGDRLAWFAVEQSKKHAAMTGRPQLLLMALVFAIMSAVTMGLWRQLKGANLRGNRTRQGPRRLR